LVQDIAALSLQSASSRYASYLLTHTSDKKPVFQLLLTKKLASFLSIKPETLSRIMGCMVRAGVITINNKEITVNNRENLSVVVCPIID